MVVAIYGLCFVHTSICHSESTESRALPLCIRNTWNKRQEAHIRGAKHTHYEGVVLESPSAFVKLVLKLVQKPVWDQEIGPETTVWDERCRASASLKFKRHLKTLFFVFCVRGIFVICALLNKPTWLLASRGWENREQLPLVSGQKGT